MRTFRGVGIALGGGATIALVALTNVVGCGGSSSGGSADASEDAVEDSTTDSSAMDSAHDTAAHDATDSSLVEASTSDSSSPDGDGGASAIDADASLPEEAGEAGRDAGPDGSVEAEAGPVAPDGAVAFLNQFAQEICGTVSQCCALGAAFNMNACVQTYVLGPYSIYGVGASAQFLDGGRLGYNPQSATQCLQLASQVGCGVFTAADLNSLQQACTGALPGQVPADDGGGGSACAASPECAAGGYCTVELTGDPDSGLGLCEPLVADGGACTKNNQCSYLALGAPSLYCSGGACVPRIATGDACNSSNSCALNLCACGSSTCTSPTCASGFVVASPALCTFLTLPDAGDGG
jgi:hypothetical protein